MWCPKCKMEYREGITVCADCGSPLVEGSAEDFDVVELGTFKEEASVDSLIDFLEYSKLGHAKKVDNEDGTFTVFVPADKEKMAEKLFRGFLLGEAEEAMRRRQRAERRKKAAMEKENEKSESVEDSDGEEAEEKEYDWDAEESEKDEKYEESEADYKDAENLGSSDNEDETPDEILYAREKRFVSKEDEYIDLKYSGITFVGFGIFGWCYMALCKMHIIPITYNPIVFVLICLMFVGFFVVGIMNGIKSTQVKLLIPEEKERMEQIMSWLIDNITQETVDNWADDNVSEVENDLVAISHIRKALNRKYPEEDPDFLEYMADEFYTEQFYEKYFEQQTAEDEELEEDLEEESETNSVEGSEDLELESENNSDEESEGDPEEDE